MRTRIHILVVLTLSLPGPITSQSKVLGGQQEANGQSDFFEMSIEELMDIQIITASKKEEKLFEVPAAAYVITSEDIRHSGATSIPDALRMVPGLQVARMNANKWAITSRGFNHEFADKMLVMIDGRSIYTPHFGGVRWDAHDVMMEDIERIEVIRGPVREIFLAGHRGYRSFQAVLAECDTGCVRVEGDVVRRLRTSIPHGPTP